MSDYSYVRILYPRYPSRSAAHHNGRMPDNEPTIALCCYKDRAVILVRCKECKVKYACPEFKTKASVVQFNAIIPPSMLLAPLPIELWPNMCADVARDMCSQSSQGPASDSADSPVRRLVSTLGLSIDVDTQPT
jgi:hypothetical protein